MQTCRDIRYQQYQRKYHHWEKETSLIVETGDVERREKTRHSQREKFKKKSTTKEKYQLYVLSKVMTIVLM